MHTHMRAHVLAYCSPGIVLGGFVCITDASASPDPLSHSVPHKQASIRPAAPFCSNLIVLAWSPQQHLSHTCWSPLMGCNLTPIQITREGKNSTVMVTLKQQLVQLRHFQ